MYRKIIVLLAVFISAGLVFSTSCTEPPPDKGSLGIKVLRASDGLPVQSELIYISRSYQDLENKIHLDSNWTDSNGFFRFRQKNPGFYWYDTQHWEDYGAAEVLNGIDADVILWVNTPDTTIRK
jgi:hypothetical protein